MTTAQILKAVRKGGKQIAIAHFYNLAPKLGIRPAGARQRPQQYPADSAERLLIHFGLSERPVHPTFAGPLATNSAKLISVRQLRAAKQTKNTKGTK